MPETTVDLDLALVIFPCDSELDDALWDGSDLESLAVLWVLLEQGRVLEGGGQLCGSVSMMGCTHKQTRRWGYAQD